MLSVKSLHADTSITLTHGLDIIREVAGPQRRHNLHPVLSEESYRIFLMQTELEQCRRGRRSYVTQVLGESKHWPCIIDRTEVGICAVIEETSGSELLSCDRVCSRTVGQACSGFRRVVPIAKFRLLVDLGEG